ncbi:MAG: NUDIX hydrolase [bacterium]
MIKNWKTLRREPFAKTPIFGVDRVRRASTTTTRLGDFYVIDCASWVNVFAVTGAGNLVAIRQYRQGTDAVTLEVPGGGIDTSESPLDAAKRELREETGYTATRWIHAGFVDVNPAIQTNQCHIFLAFGAAKTHHTELDDSEEIDVLEFPWRELTARIHAREITHSLVVAGAYFVLPLLETEYPHG